MNYNYKIYDRKYATKKDIKDDNKYSLYICYKIETNNNVLCPRYQSVVTSYLKSEEIFNCVEKAFRILYFRYKYFYKANILGILRRVEIVNIKDYNMSIYELFDFNSINKYCSNGACLYEYVFSYLIDKEVRNYIIVIAPSS